MKLIFAIMLILISVSTAFAATVDPVGLFKSYFTVENILAGIGVASIAMTGVPVPKAGTTLYKIYTVLRFVSGNFGFANHTKK